MISNNHLTKNHLFLFIYNHVGHIFFLFQRLELILPKSYKNQPQQFFEKGQNHPTLIRAHFLTFFHVCGIVSKSQNNSTFLPTHFPLSCPNFTNELKTKFII